MLYARENDDDGGDGLGNCLLNARVPKEPINRLCIRVVGLVFPLVIKS